MHVSRHRQPLISGIPASVPLILVLLAVMVAVPLSYRPESRVTSPAPAPPPPPPPAQVETRIPIEGLDANHRRLPFTVYVLSEQLSWKMESATELEGGTLINPELQAAVHRARDVLCVGTASSEGLARKEEARAGRRAANLAHWIGGVIQDAHATRLYAVNAGQYQGPKEVQSADQRKAVIIVTEGHDDAVNLSQALTSGLKKKQQEYPIVYSLLHHYSRSRDWLRIPE